MSTNLTDIFLASAPSRHRIPFGLHDNVVLKAVSNEPRRDKNGVKIGKNCFMTFAILDVANENKILSEREFSMFDLDKPQFAKINMLDQLNRLVEVVRAVVPTEHLAEAIKSFNRALIADKAVYDELATIGKKQEVPGSLLKKLVVTQKSLVDNFILTITPYLGTKGNLVQILLVTGKTGKFLDLPRETKNFISKMGGRKLVLDAKYQRWYDDRNNAETAEGDDIGKDDMVISEEEMVLDEEQVLDDI